MLKIHSHTDYEQLSRQMSSSSSSSSKKRETLTKSQLDRASYLDDILDPDTQRLTASFFDRRATVESVNTQHGTLQIEPELLAVKEVGRKDKESGRWAWNVENYEDEDYDLIPLMRDFCGTCMNEYMFVYNLVTREDLTFLLKHWVLEFEHPVAFHGTHSTKYRGSDSSLLSELNDKYIEFETFSTIDPQSKQHTQYVKKFFDRYSASGAFLLNEEVTFHSPREAMCAIPRRNESMFVGLVHSPLKRSGVEIQPVLMFTKRLLSDIQREAREQKADEERAVQAARDAWDARMAAERVKEGEQLLNALRLDEDVDIARCAVQGQARTSRRTPRK
jgi:hypothetical protein